MADTNEGQTESPVKTVEPLEPMDEIALAELLKESLAGDDEPEPQPEEPKEESESPDDPPADVEEKEEGEDVLSQEEETTEAEAEPTAELTPEQQEKFNKRIGKEVRKRKELEERNAELEAKLEEKPLAEEIVAQPTEANPYAALNSMDDVRKALLEQEQVLEWAEDNPEGAELKTKDGVMEYDADQMKEFRRSASKAIRRELPDRAEFIRTRDALEPEVLQAYPWWKDKASSEFQEATMALRAFPELMAKPNYKLVVGDAMAGQLLRMNKGKKPEQKKAVPKAPDQPTTPASQPAPVDPTAARSAAAMEEFQSSPGVEELTKVFAAQEKL